MAAPAPSSPGRLFSPPICSRSWSGSGEVYNPQTPPFIEPTMRPLSIVGILLLVLGAFIVFRGATYKSRDQVLKVGDLKASVTERHAIPTWVGGVSIVAGLVLLAGGMKRRA